jgi:hypothetical protein
MAYAAQAGGGQTVDGGVLYQYDALGSSSAVQNGVTTYFTRASDGTLVSQRPSSGGTYYYLTDGEGSVVALTDSSGTMVDQYTYEPTGKQVISNGSVWNPYQWHQAQWDAATQTYNPLQGLGPYDPTLAGMYNCSGSQDAALGGSGCNYQGPGNGVSAWAQINGLESLGMSYAEAIFVMSDPPGRALPAPSNRTHFWVLA